MVGLPGSSGTHVLDHLVAQAALEQRRGEGRGGDRFQLVAGLGFQRHRRPLCSISWWRARRRVRQTPFRVKIAALSRSFQDLTSAQLSQQSRADDKAARTRITAMPLRQPTFFIPHGGGPCFFMDDPNGTWTGMAAFLRSLPARLPEPAESHPRGFGPLGDRRLRIHDGAAAVAAVRLLRLSAAHLPNSLRRARAIRRWRTPHRTC